MTMITETTPAIRTPKQLPSAIECPIELGNANVLLANPTTVAKLVAKQSTTHSAAAMLAATQIAVKIWKPSMLTALDGYVIELRTDRTVMVQLSTGEVHGYRAQHLWDRINSRTGLPMGQNWLNRAIAARMSEVIASTNDE